MACWYIRLHAPTLIFYYAMGTIFFLQIISPINPLTFNYKGFNHGDVKQEGDAYIFQNGIEITVNTIDQSNKYSVGRVTSHEMMHLWDKSTRNLTDFTTKFSFIIFADNNEHGDGLTFFMADPNLSLQKHIKEGGGLGLVDGDEVLKSTKHSFVAVEFDTFTNKWDPQGLHLGMNFNSMKSNITKPMFMEIHKRKIYNCSIEYNSSTLNLSVVFIGYKNNTLAETYISSKVDLRNYLPEWIIFGFSAATGGLYEVHSLQSWSFSSSLESNDSVTNRIIPIGDSPISSPNSEKESKIKMLVGLAIGIGVIMSLSGLVCTLLWKRTRMQKEELVFDLNMDDEFQKGTGPKKFCYNELVSATNKFSEKLGQGGFGGVYKGYLKDLTSYVAIKRISKDSKQGIQEYATEVKIISQLRHRNLVQLIGWCHRKNKNDLLLIYEFMPNGSLDSHLYGGNGNRFLTWSVRYNIALGLASALLYLQEEWEQCVLHRDIKSSNIMLDSSFNTKLGDFGLARLVDHGKGAQTTLIAGTRGYIAPEYFTSGKANKESDIYSFGVVLLEIASGRKPVDLEAKEDQTTLVEYVWELYGLGKFLEVADPKLHGLFDKEQMEHLVVVGLWCVHPDYTFRPCIRQVIQVLKFEAPLPNLPCKMPVPTYLPPTLKAIFSSFSSSFWATSKYKSTDFVCIESK